MSNISQVENSLETRAHHHALMGMDIDDLGAMVVGMGHEPFRARQLFNWIYHRGATDFDTMTNIGKSLRSQLHQTASIARPRIAEHQQSTDGTQKWLLEFVDGNQAEMVFIPETDRGTLCISSQIGCTLTCTFCHTGTQRMVRNLGADEIIGQLLLARDCLGEWPASSLDRKITNIVFMGMGEPLLNADNVCRAIALMRHDQGIAISRRKITVSTSGVVPQIGALGEQTGVRLAISLHATNNALRDQLVPINRKYPLAQLLDSVRAYVPLCNSKRVTWEYVMLKGINDSDADAHALVALIRGIPSKINLIPFNPWPGSIYETSSNNRIEQFAQIVIKAGYTSPVRRPRGSDILAACGQLKSESVRQKRSKVIA